MVDKEKRPLHIRTALRLLHVYFSFARGMTMGVFVIDGGDNWKVSLATGKPEFTEVFLKACRDSVEVAKRVAAADVVVVRCNLSGTHREAGHRNQVAHIRWYTLREGKILRYREFYDEAAALKAAGLAQ